jgi:hypothetical protein
MVKTIELERDIKRVEIERAQIEIGIREVGEEDASFDLGFVLLITL